MDVFLEDKPDRSGPTALLDRLSVAPPLQAVTREELMAEASAFESRQIRYVGVRRQQIRRIGGHLIRHVLEEHGISVRCIGFAGGFTGSLGRSYPDAVTDARNAIRLASELHASSVVIVPGERGKHTYRHAERTVRDGLYECLALAESSRIRLLVPTDTILPGTNDCFRPRLCPLEWIEQLRCPTIRPMIVVRESTNIVDLPQDWQRSLDNGAFLRICNRSPGYERKTRLVRRILDNLVRSALQESCRRS